VLEGVSAGKLGKGKGKNRAGDFSGLSSVRKASLSRWSSFSPVAIQTKIVLDVVEPSDDKA